MFDLLHALVL
jgi:calcium permeable stress-gated cation channel